MGVATTSNTTTTTAATTPASVDCSKMSRLLLRQRLHLNLNLNVTETLQDGVDIDDVDDDDDDDEDACDEYDIMTGICDAQGSGRRRVGDNLQTVTTVPQTKQQQLRHKITTTTTTTAAATAAAATTSSSTASSALAKFNRIIESANLETHRASAAFSSATLQQRLALAYPEPQQQHQQQQQHQDMRQIDNLQRSTSRRGIAVVSTPLTLQALDTIKTKTAAMEQRQLEKQLAHDAAEQTKRNDVHYLLKQLNSFSDIEEIEIVDMKQRNQRQQQQQQQRQQQQQQQPVQQQPVQQQQQQRTTTTTKTAAASSLELMPMSTSMLPIQGAISPSTQSHKGNFMAQHGSSTGAVDVDPAASRLQFDDYLFESCHYLETNYFAATYRTAMVESSSHEFRPSTTTPTSTRSDCFELHELQPPSGVQCKSSAPPPATMHHHHDMMLQDYASPPPYHQAEVRMTSSGVQTELTAESLAQLSTGGASHSSSSSSSTPRVPPFFICCYTPIDRWRARRLGAATAAAAAAAQAAATTGAASSSASEKNGHAV